MRKLRLVCLIVVLLLGCFAGCQAAPEEGAERSIENADGTLADWMKWEIEQTYKKQFNGAEGIEHGKDMRYYGNENGYILLYSSGVHDVFYRVQIGPKFFRSNRSFTLFAYKDGFLYDLKDVYEDGLISLEAVEKALKIHREYEGY